MADDTGTVELTRPEAREVIGALTDHRVRSAGEEDVRALDIRDHLAREFDFDEYRGEDGNAQLDFGVSADDSVLDWGDGDAKEVSLSRAEAVEVIDALLRKEERLESDEAASTLDRREADTVADIREKFDDEFDVDADRIVGPDRTHG